ncbi:hypothetical protein [Pontibacter ruber]|uniref:Uncharacterized protein n=1 Tax=Pontibacter ruber TaxID=1343895 RepID=A0ABW5D0I5_9BACT|nr:hypothetical protein [Pontibacter ruber]
MRTLSFFKTVLFLASVALLIGCEKESMSDLKITTEEALGRVGDKIERPLTGTFSSSSILIGDTAAGWDPRHPSNTPAFYPGEGEGNLSHMGKDYVMYNHYAYGHKGDTAIGRTVPITDYFSLDKLREFGFTEAELEEIEAEEVGVIITDKHGNSIWLEGTGNFPKVEGMPQRRLLMWEYEIIGGTGRFEGAEGQVTLNGYTDFTVHADHTITTSDEFTLDGVIIY